MIKLINELVDSASSDAEIRQKIANLPQTVSDASGLKKIKGMFFDVHVFCYLYWSQAVIYLKAHS